jgi:peptidoglycan/xylan/chitin deacetylase (PgdA/CDA1 family)
MHLDRQATLLFTAPLVRAGVLRMRRAIPILMYHSVSDSVEKGVSPYYRVTTSPARFREHMRWLHEHGFVVIDLAEALRRLDAGIGLDRAVVVTFDDGFQDFLTEAWPALAQYGFRASMFLPTAYISNDRRSFKGRPCLTWSEVRELQSQGVSFGSHTVSHPVLHDLPWSDVARELRDSKVQIEDEVQERVDTFAYPFAFPQEDRPFVTRLRRELADLGFTGAVTTAIGRAKPGHDPLCLRRLPVNDCDDYRLFTSKLAGAYDWLGPVQLLSRTAKVLTR